jgi:two-component system response regulator AtoC
MAAGGTNHPSDVSSMGGQLPPESVIFGCTRAMSLVRQRAEKVASTNVSVLVEGEGGTGKELSARWIHGRSPRSSGPFVKVNCAAIPGSLLESELFGYEKGAFTGAYNRKPGRVEQADLGTLFLDEIADLDLSLQSKLLHFLQDGRFTRIGDTSERSVDIRLICATHKNLSEEVDSGKFRADLFYRINVVQLGLPQLRKRREDIPQLANYLRVKHEKQFGKTTEPFRPETLEYLQNLIWPGNVRELSNEVARYVLIGFDGLTSGHPPRRTGSDSGTSGATNAALPLKQIAREAVRETERSVILQALKANQWNRRKTAQSLKISYRALIYKITEAGLSTKSSPSKSAAAANGKGGGEHPNSPRGLAKRDSSG